ncbi:hypothetical protein ACOSQ4_004464 [Xanthoceras sorbifolium]
MRIVFELIVTTIKESKDVDSMIVDELVRSLQTFELNLKQSKKQKEITLKSISHESENADGEKLVYVARKLKKFFNGRRTDGGFKGANVKRDYLPRKFDNNKGKSKGVQYFECQGFGHIASECVNIQNNPKKGKALNTTWSDSDDEFSDAGKHTCNIVAFTYSLSAGDGIPSEDDAVNDVLIETSLKRFMSNSRRKS